MSRPTFRDWFEALASLAMILIGLGAIIFGASILALVIAVAGL